MPKVSRWTLEQKREKELLNQFWTAITLLEDKKEVIDFFKALLMPSESIMLAKRIEMVKLHDSGLSFTDLRRLLHITKVTAYRWKERFDLYYREFKMVIDRLRELEQEKLENQARQRQPIKPHGRSGVLGKTIKTVIYLGDKKYKKLKRRSSAKMD